MLMIQIVCRFVQYQNRRVFQQKLHEQHLGALTAGKVGNISVKADVPKPKPSCDFAYFRVQLIKAAVFEDLLDFSGIFHHLVHPVCIFGKSHILVNFQHFPF